MNRQTDRQINHKVLRVVVGCIALLLAPTVYFLSGSDKPLTSISISYWTDSRDIFVGSLVAVGFFLSAYNGGGNGRDCEYFLSKAACVFAICVAFFPTEGFSQEDIPVRWVRAITEILNTRPQYVHYFSAILFFACLIAMMWFFSKRAMAKGKAGRAYFYRTVSVLMATGIIVLGIYGRMTHSSNTTLLIEIWGLSLFGIGWLVAGSYKTDPLLDKQ
ncbi:MAG: hypothetical protein R3240_08570 [Gammaproteobacteria bacterium]|nr:hypothetical protein [Gammaproteobacteria bacterium]